MELREVIYLYLTLGTSYFRKNTMNRRTKAPIIFNFKILLCITGSRSLRSPNVQGGLKYIIQDSKQKHLCPVLALS
jgi:hypothetical protein